MKLSKSKIIGLIALLAVVGVVCGTLVWRQSQPAPAEPTEQVSITGYLGGEKIGLFDDAKFKALAAKQGIAIDYRKAGSPAMMDTDRKGMGYLFPSSRAAVEYGNAKGVKAPPKRHRLQLTDCAIHAQGRGGRARERRTCDQRTILARTTWIWPKPWTRWSPTQPGPTSDTRQATGSSASTRPIR